ncbi:MAG: divergent polysaccharide deacetylase family protein [Sneathiellaceae bacterium]
MAGKSKSSKAGGARAGGGRGAGSPSRARKRSPGLRRAGPLRRIIGRLATRPTGVTRLALTGVLGAVAIAAALWLALTVPALDWRGIGSGDEGGLTVAVSRPAPRAITAPRRTEPQAIRESEGAEDDKAPEKDAIGDLIQQLETAQGGAPRGNPEAADAAAVAALPRPGGGSAGEGQTWRREPEDREFGEAGFPRIAIVIDDLGGSADAVARLMALPGPVTYAFLTAHGGTPDQSRTVAAAGQDVILHMPMEPLGQQDPGPNALLIANSPEENLRRLRWHLARLPLARGVNNHMGSRFTADGERLRPVLAALKEAGLFWLDSRTSGRSVGYEVARDLQMRTVHRDIFLDHEPVEATILGQLRNTEAVAAREGYAIAIGHPYPETLAMLERWMPEAQRRGFVLVGITDLLPRAAAAPQTVSGATTGTGTAPRMSN